MNINENELGDKSLIEFMRMGANLNGVYLSNAELFVCISIKTLKIALSRLFQDFQQRNFLLKGCQCCQNAYYDLLSSCQITLSNRRQS